MISLRRLTYTYEKVTDCMFSMQILIILSVFMSLSVLCLIASDYSNLFACLFVVVGMGVIFLSCVINYYKEFDSNINDDATSSH